VKKSLFLFLIINICGIAKMPKYLVQVEYQTKAWTALVRDPQDRLEIAGPVVKNLGGRIECAYLSFGKYDSMAILEVLDNVSAAALSMVLLASGVFKKIKITSLMTWEDGVEAMKKAKKAAYNPPSDGEFYLDRSS
jgi:uncharacterized protein with GYD domain